MRITRNYLEQFTGDACSDITILDLGGLSIERIENLDAFTGVETLILHDNIITSIDEECELYKNIELWNIDVSENHISNLEGIVTTIRLLGSLNLRKNKMNWEELVVIRDMTILELNIEGNIGIESADNCMQ
jgi:hypothetical protein